MLGKRSGRRCRGKREERGSSLKRKEGAFTEKENGGWVGAEGHKSDRSYKMEAEIVT